jgi:hypothetical protein
MLRKAVGIIPSREEVKQEKLGKGLGRVPKDIWRWFSRKKYGRGLGITFSFSSRRPLREPRGAGFTPYRVSFFGFLGFLALGVFSPGRDGFEWLSECGKNTAKEPRRLTHAIHNTTRTLPGVPQSCRASWIAPGRGSAPGKEKGRRFPFEGGEKRSPFLMDAGSTTLGQPAPEKEKMGKTKI